LGDSLGLPALGNRYLSSTLAVVAIAFFAFYRIDGCPAGLAPERCHRRYVADELVRRGWTVIHILRPGETRRHRLEPRQRPLALG